MNTDVTIPLFIECTFFQVWHDTCSSNRVSGSRLVLTYIRPTVAGQTMQTHDNNVNSMDHQKQSRFCSFLAIYQFFQTKNFTSEAAEFSQLSENIKVLEISSLLKKLWAIWQLYVKFLKCKFHLFELGTQQASGPYFSNS